MMDTKGLNPNLKQKFMKLFEGSQVRAKPSALAHPPNRNPLHTSIEIFRNSSNH